MDELNTTVEALTRRRMRGRPYSRPMTEAESERAQGDLARLRGLGLVR